MRPEMDAEQAVAVRRYVVGVIYVMLFTDSQRSLSDFCVSGVSIVR